jgi:multiple sugar transport system permease protein
MVLGAFHEPGRPPPAGLELVPESPSLAAFERAADLVPLWRQLLNSLTVVAVAVPLTVVCASMAGFAMTRLRGRAHAIAIGFTLVCLTIPLAALWVPRFAIFRSLGVLDT